MTPTATPPPRTQVNSPTLVIGVSGSGKSALLATYAIWVWETFQKVTLYVNVDGGGFPAIIERCRDLGIMRLWRARTRCGDQGELAFETCQRATQGWWPSEIDPATGETAPSVRLVPPLTQSYKQHCPNGHHLKTVPFQKLLTPQMCKTCNTHTTGANQRVEILTERTPGFEDVGAMAFDGISSMCSWGMMDLARRVGRRELGGEEGSIGGKVGSGDVSWGANNRAHFGFTQQRAEEFCTNALTIPGMVVPPIFTGLTHEASDRGSLPIVGPELAGQAKTATAVQWFGNCFEACPVTDDKGHKHFRIYLSEWYDEQNRRHLCKHRGGPIGVPEYVQDDGIDPATGEHEGTPFSRFNLGHVFELIESSKDSSLTAFGAALDNAPGMPEGKMTYGRSVTITEGEAGGEVGVSPTAAGKAKAAPKPKPRPRAQAKAPASVGPAQEKAPAAAPDAPEATTAAAAPVTEAPAEAEKPPEPTATPAPPPAPTTTAGPSPPTRPAPPAARPPAQAPGSRAARPRPRARAAKTATS